MPNYTNAVAATSQVHVYAASLTLSYDNIALIPGIPHKYQIEVERIFTTARAGSPIGIVAFQSDAAVPVEQKRDVYIIPETLNNNTYLTFNETAKTITIAADLSTLNKVYTNPSNTVYVPNIVAGQVITFRRKTISNTPLVTWSSGTKLTSNQLNLETTQLLYLVQEVLDRVYRQISISGDIVSQIADNAITTSKIVDLNVTTIKINDLAVTTAKLADLNVTTSKINDLAVTTAKIADYNITPAKLINTTQAWSLTGTLALTDLATSATGDKVANKNYVLDRVSKYGVITKDSTVTSNVLDTPPTIPTDANDDVSLQSGGIWFNPRDGGLRVKVLDKWVRLTGTPLTINDYISTDGTAQTKLGNLTLNGNLTVDTNTLFVDSTNHKLGIGTIIPSEKLTVSGNTNISGNLTVDTNTLYVNSTSNIVGIGTTSPDQRLTIQSAGDAQISLKNSSGVTKGYIGTAGTFGSGGTDDLMFRSESNNILFGFSGAETLRFTNGGNVGIGTSSPSEKLEVSGNIKASGTLTLGSATMATPSGSAPLFGCRAWVRFDGTQDANVSATYSYPTSDPNKVTVTLNNHGYLVGHRLNVTVTTGGGESGDTYVTDVVNSNTFKYATAQAATTNRSGNVTLNRRLINGAGNIHSITKLVGAGSLYPNGHYAVNFASAMPDANYCATLSYSAETVNNGTSNEHALGWISAVDTTYINLNFWHSNTSTSTVNKSVVNVSIFR
jgi:hypothetical protein